MSASAYFMPAILTAAHPAFEQNTNQPFALALHKSRFADAHHSRPWAGGRALRPAPDGRFRGNGLDITHQTLPPLWRGERMDNDLAQLGMQSRE
jgi:hypothetical protein